MHSDDRTRSTGPDRRTVLRSAVGAGAAMVAWAGAAAGQEGYQFGYHNASESLISRTLVVYREPERVEEPVCELDDPVRHSIVGTANPTEPVVYADLYVERRYGPGTALAVVDRVQGCEQDGTQHAGVLVEAVSQPPDESAGTAGDGDGNATDDAANGG